MIVIRADGGKGIGMGHLMRTSVLAKELAKDYRVVYICDQKYYEGKEFLNRQGLEVIMSANPLEDIINQSAQCILTDNYEIDDNYIEEVRKKFKVVGYMDDDVLKQYKADFIINQNYGAESLDYSTCKVDDLFLGTRYLLVREEFRNVVLEQKGIKDNIEKHVMLTVGGTDLYNYTEKILSMIYRLPYIVHVVIGNVFPYKEQIIGTYSKYKNIQFEINPNMLEVMQKCDLAISSCGSTLYELGLMQVPVIGYTLADNQQGIANRMSKDGLIKLIGSIKELQEEELKKQIINLLQDKLQANEMVFRCKQKLNPNGVIEISEYIKRRIAK